MVQNCTLSMKWETAQGSASDIPNIYINKVFTNCQEILHTNNKNPRFYKTLGKTCHQFVPLTPPQKGYIISKRPSRKSADTDMGGQSRCKRERRRFKNVLKAVLQTLAQCLPPWSAGANPRRQGPLQPKRVGIHMGAIRVEPWSHYRFIP